MSAITINDLHKSYGPVKAVDGISLEVEEGEIFGFLGPNGAGKTTTIEIVEGYRKPDSGIVRILGLNPFKQGYQIKERIGIMLESTSIYPDLRVGEVVALFAGYYRQTANYLSLLDMIALQDKMKCPVRELSGGQKQKLAFVLALINDPELLLLDEPTTGLDVQTRRYVWELIQQYRDKGKTVFLTTHYIEEAEALCDRVAIIDYGTIIALDTPRRLMANLDVEQRIEFVTDNAIDAQKIEETEGVQKVVETRRGEFTLYVQQPQRVLMQLTVLAKAEGWNLSDLRVEGATLEDVFLNLTGRRMRE